MIKSIKIPGSRIRALVNLCFSGVSESEYRLLETLISFSTNNSITLTADLSKQIISTAGISQSSFNTSLHRLEKKGIINSVGKTKNLHPVFNNILDCEKILISFQDQKP